MGHSCTSLRTDPTAQEDEERKRRTTGKMKLAIVALLLVGFAAASTDQEDFLRELFQRGEDDARQAGVTTDYCKQIQAFVGPAADFKPLTMAMINEAVKSVQEKTKATVTAVAAAAKAAIEKAKTVKSADAIIEMTYTYGKLSAASPLGVLNQFYAMVDGTVKKLVNEGVVGLKDDANCTSLARRWMEVVAKINGNAEEMLKVVKDPQLHKDLAMALIEDFTCIKTGIDRLMADVDNFSELTPQSSSRAVAFQVFGFFYDGGRLRRDVMQMLCTGQKLGGVLKSANRFMKKRVGSLEMEEEKIKQLLKEYAEDQKSK